MPKWDTITVNGEKFDVEITADGRFKAKDKFTGDDIYRGSLKLLKDALTKLSRSKPLNIPFVCSIGRWTDIGDAEATIRRGKIIGIHSGNGNLIVQFDDHKDRDQISHHQTIYRGDMDLKKFGRLKEEVRKAEQDLSEFLETNTLDRLAIAKAREVATK